MTTKSVRIIETAIYNAVNRVLRRCGVINVLFAPALVSSNSFNTSSPSRGGGWNETNPGITGVKYNPSAPLGSASNPYKPLPTFVTEVYAKAPAMVESFKTTGQVAQLSSYNAPAMQQVTPVNIAAPKTTPVQLSTLSAGTTPVQLSTLAKYQTAPVIPVAGLDAATVQKMNEKTGSLDNLIANGATNIQAVPLQAVNLASITIDNAKTGALSSLVRPGNLSQIDAAKTVEYLKTITGAVDPNTYNVVVQQPTAKIMNYAEQTTRSFESIKQGLSIDLGNNIDAVKSIDEIGGYNLAELGKQATDTIQTLTNDWEKTISAADKARQDIINAVVAKVTGTPVEGNEPIYVKTIDLPNGIKGVMEQTTNENGVTNLRNIAEDLIKYVADGNTINKMQVTYGPEVSTIKGVEDILGKDDGAGQYEVSFFVNVIKETGMLATDRSQPTQQIKIVQHYNTEADAIAAQERFLYATDNNHGTKITTNEVKNGELRTRQISVTAGNITKASDASGTTKITIKLPNNGERTETIGAGRTAQEVKDLVDYYTEKYETVSIDGKDVADGTLAASEFVRKMTNAERSASGALLAGIATKVFNQEAGEFKDIQPKTTTTTVDNSRWSTQVLPDWTPEALKGAVDTFQDLYLGENKELATKGYLNEYIKETEGSFNALYGSQTVSTSAALPSSEQYFKLTESGMALREQVVAAKQAGDLQLNGFKETEAKLNTLVYNLEFAPDDAYEQQMRNDIISMPDTVLVRDLNSFHTAIISNVVGEERLASAYSNPIVINNYREIFVGQSADKAWVLLEEVASPNVTGIPIFDIPIMVLTGGIAGELDLLTDALKVGNALGKVAELSKSVAVVTSFLDYAKTAGVAIPNSMVTDAFAKAIPTGVGSALITSPNTGSIAKVFADNSKLSTITDLTKKVPTNAGSASKLTQDFTRALDAATPNYRAIGTEMSTALNKYPTATINAAAEIQLTNPQAFNKITDAIREAGNADVAKSLKTIQNEAYNTLTKQAEDFVNKIDSATVPAKAMAESIETLTLPVVERLTKIASEEVMSNASSAVRDLLTQMDKNIKPVVMTDQKASEMVKGTSKYAAPGKLQLEKLMGITNDEARTLINADIKTLDDLTAIGEKPNTSAALKVIEQKTGISTERLQTLVNRAQSTQELAKDDKILKQLEEKASSMGIPEKNLAPIAKTETRKDALIRVLDEEGALDSEFYKGLKQQQEIGDIKTDEWATAWKEAERIRTDLQTGQLRMIDKVDETGKTIRTTQNYHDAAQELRDGTMKGLQTSLAKDLDNLLDTRRLPDGTLLSEAKPEQWRAFKARMDATSKTLSEEVEAAMRTKEVPSDKYVGSVIDRVAAADAAEKYITKLPPDLQSAARTALETGVTNTHTIQNIMASLPPKDAGHFLSTLRIEGGQVPFCVAAQRVGEEIFAKINYIDLLPTGVREEALNILETNAGSIDDINSVLTELKKLGPVGDNNVDAATHFAETLQMKGEGIPKLSQTQAKMISDAMITPDALPRTGVFGEASTKSELPTMTEFGKDTSELPTNLPIKQKSNGLIVPKEDIPNTQPLAGEVGTRMEAAVRNSEEYKALNAADKNVVDNALDYGNGLTTERMTGDAMNSQVLTDKEALAEFREFSERNPILGKAVQITNDANMFAATKYVSFDSFNDAAKALAKDDFSEAAKTFSKMNGQETKGMFTGDFYFNKSDSALKNADVSQIRALAKEGVSRDAIELLIEKRSKMATDIIKSEGATDIQKAFGKAMIGEKLNLDEAEKLYKSGLNNEIDNALAGSRMAEATQTSEIYAKSLKEELLSKLINEEPIGDIKKKLDDLLEQAKKDDIECKKAGRDCSGGSGGGSAAGSAAVSGSSNASKTTIIAAATAAAAGATLTTTGQANLSPGEYDITNQVFNTLSLDYRNGIPHAREGTTRGAGSQIFNNEGYDGKSTMKVEGDVAGIDNLNKALNWVKSDANTIVKDNTYKKATINVTTNPDGSMNNELSLGGRGLTYECEQYSLDTAKALEAAGVKDVFIAILGSGDDSRTNMAHAVVAIKTGERLDVSTDKTFPTFALIEPQESKTGGGRLVGMVGSGDPITSIGDGIQVTDIQLISPSAFLDYKGTRGIWMPEKGETYQYSDVPTMDLEISPFLLSTPEQKGDELSPATLAANVAAGTLTQKDADRITAMLGE